MRFFICGSHSSYVPVCAFKLGDHLLIERINQFVLSVQDSLVALLLLIVANVLTAIYF